MVNACLNARTSVTLWFGVIVAICYLVNGYMNDSFQNVTAAKDCSFFITTLEVTLLLQISLLGLYGVHKRKPFYLKLYVIISVCTILVWLTAVLFVTYAFGNQYLDLEKLKYTQGSPVLVINDVHLTGIIRAASSNARLWRNCFFMVLWIWVKSYFARVVYSYYSSLKKELEENPPTYKTAVRAASRLEATAGENFGEQAWM